MKDISVALINPPLASVTQPFIALAALQGHLRLNGVRSTRIWDVSQDIMCRLLEEEHLVEVRLRLEKAIRGFENRQSLRLAESRHYRAALEGRAALNHAGPRLADALRDLRDPERFYDLQAYQLAVQTVSLAFQAISGAFYPERITWTSYDASVEEDLESSEQLLSFIDQSDRCLFAGHFRKGMLPEIVESEPDVIGLTATFFSQFLPSLVVARELKRHLPKAHIVLGGAFASDRIDHIRNAPWFFDIIDSVVVYEGESALLELVRAVAENRPTASVVNLYHRMGDQVIPPARLKTESLEQLAAPDYTGYSIDQYLAPGWDLIYDPTRGCYWNKCTFCAVSLSSRRALDRTRNARQVVEHLEDLCEKHDTNVVTFGVDAIAVPFMRDVCREILRRNLDVRWSSEFILDKRLDRETLALFAEAGCLMLLFGLESAAPRILKLMRKGIVPERAARLVRYCREVGIHSLLHLIVGFPTETWQEVEETISLVEQMAEDVDIYEIGPFSLVEKTPAFDMAKQLEIREVSPLKRPFQSWNVRPFKQSRGIETSEVCARLPSIRTRIDRALKLQQRSSLMHLRQDTAHLHLYLTKTGLRPREIHREAGATPGTPVDRVLSPFDLCRMFDLQNRLNFESNQSYRRTALSNEDVLRQLGDVRLERGEEFGGLLFCERHRVVPLTDSGNNKAG